ncbi:hypothetical protein [Streptococcus moroccensis]|uniref:Uncharacterized protein YcfL n=1 Tax=Streptococcus moroccensis TaxID=1451356 RepID=A0ABT9YQQ8_9STRE|nr:hypothetical protein [Streptococcus moroccensis]MDQ0222331.1 uncharacterized protein YcfL [Streptococcus moroccensis]
MKKVLIYVSISLTVFLLTGCSLFGAKTVSQEKITVYDTENNNIFESTNQEVLDVFGEYIGQAGGTVEGTEIFSDVPDDAHVLYRFEFTGETGHGIHLYNYSNYDYLLLEKLPIIGDMRLEMDKGTAEWMRHPANWESN